jgi:class 3 adenylate cyclase
VPEADLPDAPPAADAPAWSGGSRTRAFLFSDLRGYTAFVERHGAAAAADLLLRYRSAVRESVAQFRGAEIRTEGDSFYVVFETVSDAVRCGIGIVDRAASAGDGGAPIQVGVGIHAGETVETPDGPVGSAVNVAARICALARPGEILVSDTVRALTTSTLDVGYVGRGRHRLKGVVDPVSLFAVQATGRRAVPERGRRRLAIGGLAALAAVAAVGVGIVLVLGPVGGGSSATPFPGGDVPELDGGRYVTTAFHPVFELTVPDGWKSSGDFIDAIGVGPQNRPGIEMVFLKLQAVFGNRCGLDPQLVASAADVIAVLQERDDLRVDDVRPVAYGGNTGIRADVTPHPRPPCTEGPDPFDGVSPLWPIAGDRLGALGAGVTNRVVVLDTPGGMLTVHMTGDDVDLFWEDAEPVLETLRVLDD